MRLNTNAKKTTLNSWQWFVGLYAAGLVAYGVIEMALHYLNTALMLL